jgi:IclR family pca regulon transcriptional regulator
MEGDEKGRASAQPFPTLPATRYSQSLERGLAILACFTPECPVLGIAELAERLGMSRPTTHRYVSTLAKQGYLQQDASRRYRLSLGTMDLGLVALNATGLCTHARPDLEALAQFSGYRVQLAVLDGLEILLLDSVISTRNRQGKTDLEIEAGSRLPAYCTSMGKVLLAYLPAEQQLRRISETQLTKRGPNTITSEKLLRRQLEQVRAAGLAVNDEESAAGTCAIAAPVRDESADVVATISVVTHHWVTDIEGLVDSLERQLILTAERISKRLGWEEEDK